LKPGSIFLLVDGHPFFDLFEYHDGALAMRYDYFHSPEPDECFCETSYVNRDRKLVHAKTYEWTHDLGGILDAVLDNGMELITFKEYPFSFYQKHPNMVKNQEGRWVLENSSLPLLMSLKARKKS